MIFNSTRCQNSVLIDLFNENKNTSYTLVWNTDLNKEIENYPLEWRGIWSHTSSKNLMLVDDYYFNLDNGIPNYYFQIQPDDIKFWHINSNEDTLILFKRNSIFISSKYNIK